MLASANLESSFSAVSKPTFASKYSLESSRRDLHNALLLHRPLISIFPVTIAEIFADLFLYIQQILQKVAELLLNFDQTFSGCSQNAALLRLILKIAGKKVR